ncbi:MAG: fasciclin domain-containing protein [Glycocaulis sp.]
MRLTALISSTAAAAALLAAPVLADHHSGPADIVDTAVAADGFNTLVAAVQAADLVDALKGEGPFTVFAPTDEAFAALPEGTVETLLRPENIAQLQGVLTYHVVAGSYASGDVAPGSYSLATLQGSEVTIVVAEDGAITVDGANVIAADIAASNGVIHVIDAVILPN